MQTASDLFFQRADAQMRPINWALFISFARELDPSATFFTVGVSSVGGDDPIMGNSSVLQLWDQYQYLDYSDRVVTMEWSNSIDPLYSVQSALGDITLRDTDDYLSADDFLLPYRPVRISMGFGNTMTGDSELLPQFVGVTAQAPTINRQTKTSDYHVLDFLGTLLNRPLNEAVLLTDVTTDQALDALLQLMGLSPTQYDLDPGFNVIPVVYFDATATFGDAANQLMQAEMGRLYMTEEGRITFHNRENFSDNSADSVWYFDEHNVIDFQTSTQTDLINVVKITSNFLQVQANQKVWQLGSPVLIPAGGTAQVLASFADPVVTVDSPVDVLSATTSSFTANKLPDGSGDQVDSSVAVATTQYATSYLMTFTNSNSFNVYITDIELFATPAKSVNSVTVTEQDDNSVDQYDEQLLEITNNFFVDEETAISKAKIILGDNSTYDVLNQVTVKGNPALQVNDPATFAIREHSYIAVSGDTLSSVAAAYGMTLAALEALNPTLPHSGSLGDGTQVKLGIVPELCTILGIQNMLDTPQFKQILTVKPISRASYFKVGISSVGGSDIIAP